MLGGALEEEGRRKEGREGGREGRAAKEAKNVKGPSPSLASSLPPSSPPPTWR